MAEHDCLKQEVITQMKKDIENLYTSRDVVLELKTLVSILIEQNKKQDENLNKQSEILMKVTEANTQQGEILRQQGEVLKKLSDRHDELDNKFCQKNIDELKDNSISFNSIIRMAIDKALPPLIYGGLAYLILEITNK